LKVRHAIVVVAVVQFVKGGFVGEREVERVENGVEIDEQDDEEGR
jgi:hypothetical protein